MKMTSKLVSTYIFDVLATRVLVDTLMLQLLIN